MTEINVIGGGLAGSEAAWQAAERGHQVCLYEMRPEKTTGAHTSSNLAELVCSNSLGSILVDRAPGVLKNEISLMNSLLLRIANENAVPAGGALAVDRERFARRVTEALRTHPNIEVIRREIVRVPTGITIIATGPLTSPAMSESIIDFTGSDHLYFYDAIAPIIDVDSINFNIAFRASRFGYGELQQGDYINCPLNQVQYQKFVEALVSAQSIELRDFENDIKSGVKAGAHKYFEGCLPIEVLGRRGKRSLAYGPMRPIGLRDPRTNRGAYAVVQLRQDNLAASLYNMVGFQTNLTFAEQRRVFRMIPGLENAGFERYGQMHRNTFIYSPANLNPSLQFHNRADLFFAGQIIGVEGYVGNIATGLLAGINAARFASNHTPLCLPKTTMLGALCDYISNAAAVDFQPMKANFGILPALEPNIPRNKRDRAARYAMRAIEDISKYLRNEDELKIG